MIENRAYRISLTPWVEAAPLGRESSATLLLSIFYICHYKLFLELVSTTSLSLLYFDTTEQYFDIFYFPGQNLAILIFWHIFTGWSATRASAFSAAFFKRYAFRALFVSLVPILLAVIAAFEENINYPVAPLSQLVPWRFFSSLFDVS
jgi:hypothetical protein